MTDRANASDGTKMARDLLRFFDEVMRAIAPVELGDPAVAQLTLLEMQVLSALAEAGRPVAVGELAGLTEASLRQTGQATDRLRSLGLAERAGGGRGWEPAFWVARGGRRLLGSLDAGRQAAVEGFIARLGNVERLRLEAAAHLLGRDLDRLSEGMLTA
jgi:hypothetical protein